MNIDPKSRGGLIPTNATTNTRDMGWCGLYQSEIDNR